jgi:hypothetical protein
VQLYKQPDMIFVTPPQLTPPRVAVRADQSLFTGQDKLALSIVLDCSGSMHQRVGGKGRRRWDEATDALDNLLRTLPNGVFVSLGVYGADQISGMVPGSLRNSPSLRSTAASSSSGPPTSGIRTGALLR